jgi:hypothetical protein
MYENEVRRLWFPNFPTRMLIPFRRDTGAAEVNPRSGPRRPARAIPGGLFQSRKGRTCDRMSAIFGALALLTGIVIAWNADRSQSAVRSRCRDLPKDQVRHFDPIAGVSTAPPFHIAR